VWVDPLKIGQTAGMQKMASVFTSKKKKDKGRAGVEEIEICGPKYFASMLIIVAIVYDSEGSSPYIAFFNYNMFVYEIYERRPKWGEMGNLQTSKSGRDAQDCDFSVYLFSFYNAFFILYIINTTDDEDEFGGENEAESRRKWLKMMMTAADGWSDPAVRWLPLALHRHLS
tara:strand:+ start:287 stop:799 length:513 start_codon:yes stop_codon:yes gene_type:complete